MKLVLGILMLTALLLLGAGCGPKETREEVAATDAAIDKQQEEYYKSHPNATEPAKSDDALTTSAGQAAGH